MTEFPEVVPGAHLQGKGLHGDCPLNYQAQL